MLKYVIICPDKSEVTYYGRIGIEAFFCSYCRWAKAGGFCVDGFILMKLRLFTVRSVVIEATNIVQFAEVAKQW